MPPGVVTPPPSSVTAKFTVTPGSPTDHQVALFDGSQSTSTTGTIVQWLWNFGDGSTASGITSSHTFRTAGNFVVSLTVVDSIGASNSSSQTITVAQGPNPTASFVVSPAAPVINQSVNFNASASTAAAGRTIASYHWDFGDGTTGSGVTTSHTFVNAGTYTVVLLVTDDAGHTGTVTSTIVSYHGDFGDGSTGSGATTSHAYSTAGAKTVTLIVTDDQGKTGIATATVTIN